MRRALPILLAAAALAAPAAVAAQVAVGAHAATTGFGPDLQWRLNDNFSVRAQADWLDFGYGRTFDDVRYDGRLKLATGGAFVDVHPWRNGFFVSGGAYFGDRRVTISAAPARSVTIGGVAFTPAQIGRLDGRIKMASAAPFVGLGGETRAGPQARGLAFKGLVGVAFSGRPTVDLASSGGLFTGSPILQQALVNERARIADKVEALQYYPVVQVGLAWRF